MLNEQREVIYVGKAKDLKKRLSSYFNRTVKDLKTTSLVQKINDIQVIITHTETEAVLLECNLIKKFTPRYNVLLRDDKSYPYIFISNHQFPRIDFYRGQRKKNGRYFGHFPHSTAVRETISLLQKTFQLRTCHDTFFRARTRPCLLYQIGRCTAPCVNLIAPEDYEQNVKLACLFLEGKSEQVISVLQTKMQEAALQHDYEKAADYRDKIARLRQIQDRQYVSRGGGEADIIAVLAQSGITCVQILMIRQGQLVASQSYFPTVPAHATTDEILSAFLSQHYLSTLLAEKEIPPQIIIEKNITDLAFTEAALTELSTHSVQLIVPVRGEKMKWLSMAMNNVKQSLFSRLQHKKNILERFQALQACLALKKLPARIECFDISHTMGEATVASCVVFNQEGPAKTEYRRFNIKGLSPGDDIAAMRQAILRRYKKISEERTQWPEVILIDGGHTHLLAVQETLAQYQSPPVFLMAISKGPGRKAGYESLHFISGKKQHLPADSLALHLLQHIRDEAHRFAISGHRRLRDKARRQSALEKIAGIGVHRRRELLRYFGGIQAVAHASLDELKKVRGISHSLAQRIFAALHDTSL